ncbi:MAG: hypothetical protein QOH88_2984 [Verrucomicrobiota bacterium]|jgi:hypothetical protein
MRLNFLFYFFASALTAMGCAYQGEVVHKISRERPDTSMTGQGGIHSFVFRGPTGTSRPPITLPGPEFWGTEPSGKYAFYLRDKQGSARWQLVTPEVFARYEIGQYFNDAEAGPSRDKYSTDAKTMQLVVRHHRTKTAHARSSKHRNRVHRALAKHRRNHHSNHIAQN